MVFSSLLFLFYFLPAVLLVYFLTPRRFRNMVLFVASLIFYAWGEPKYIVIMLLTSLADYGFGLLIGKFKDQGQTGKAKAAVAVAVVANLGVLAFFKYADFAIHTVNGLLGTAIPPVGLPLPIGISFYTFQALSYTIDVYRRDAKAQRSFVAFGTYIALFPQLIAGPIVRFKTIAEQLDHRQETYDLFASGIQRFLIGLGKKVLIANNVGLIWNQVSAMDPATLPLVTAWLGILAFTLQIYFDFSGYSDMAIGLGRMFGFEFLENFNYPYIAKSITEFWRRWHISLSTWFKEYLYIPLGGNRRGLPRQILNLLIVWMLTGLWHGASWNFVAWGLFFGILLILEKLFLLRWLQRAPGAIGHLYTLLLVAVSWVLFAFDSLPQGFAYIQALFGGFGASLADGQSIYLLYTNAALLLMAMVGSTTLPSRFAGWLRGWRPRLATVLCCAGFALVALLCVAYLVDSTYNPFLYFRF